MALSSLTVLAQERVPLQVNYADSLVFRTVGDESIRELIGHVDMHQEKVHIQCDRAIQNISKNNAELVGNVVITQDTLTLKTIQGLYDGDKKTATCDHGILINDGKLTLTADNGDYNTSQRIAHFFRKVVIEDSANIILANELTYYRDSSKAIATNNVVITSKQNNSIITGDSVIHYIKRKVSFIPLHPRLWQIDSTVVRRDSITKKIDSLRLDTLSIVCKKMEAYRDSTSMYITRDSVEMVRGDLRARCNEGLYYSRDSLVILRLKPILWFKENQLIGDSMIVGLANEKIDHLNVYGNAFAISRSKPSEKDTIYPQNRFDQVKGKNLFMKFKNDDIDSVIMNKMAMRVYFMYDGRALNGVGIESGDQIIMSFKNGKAHRIKTVSGIEGKYYPEKMTGGKETTFNLDGFEWREDRPSKQEMNFKIPAKAKK